MSLGETVWKAEFGRKKKICILLAATSGTEVTCSNARHAQLATTQINSQNYIWLYYHTSLIMGEGKYEYFWSLFCEVSKGIWWKKYIWAEIYCMYCSLQNLWTYLLTKSNFSKIRKIIHNAYYFLFSTALSKIFYIKDDYTYSASKKMHPNLSGVWMNVNLYCALSSQ